MCIYGRPLFNESNVAQNCRRFYRADNLDAERERPEIISQMAIGHLTIKLHLTLYQQQQQQQQQQQTT